MREHLFIKQVVPDKHDPEIFYAMSLGSHLTGRDHETLRALAWQTIADMGCPIQCWCDLAYEGHWFRVRTYRGAIEVEALHIARPGAPSIYALPDRAA